MREVREIEINSFADTLKVRPWPVTPPPSKEEVMKVYARRKAEEFGKFTEEILGFESVFDKPEALQGLKVLDVGIWRLGNAFASSLLAELGAEVIKVEPPTGDPLRQLTPFGREEYMLKDAERGEPCGLEFIAEMRNKYSITLNLETPEGRELYKKLACHADVIIENYPPGQFDEWGIGYRQISKLNPRVIYCWIGILGQWGPLKDRVSKYGQWMLEPFAQAANSYIHNTGFPQDLLPRGSGGDPTRSGVWIADYAAGEQAAVNILAALYYRDEFSGRGQFIEVTSAEALMEIMDFDISWYGFNRSIKARTGGWDPNLNQYAWNPCKDGYMMIGGQTDRLWYRICMCIERELPQFGRLITEDPFLKEIAARNAFQALVKTYTLTTMWLRENTRAQVEKKLLEYEVAAGPVMTIDEVAEFPHFKYRRWVDIIEDSNYGELMYAVSPNSYQHRTPARVKWMGRPLGYDNAEIYRRYLGLGYEQLRELKEKGVI
ncbi:CaiB/BaiF CoA transferase family protein [Desulfovirgula thermocuniculi]|uniref:CaiB/BaiF CoA transferase family protein n=1 Tax=Desulfovirgula thermocuniculi TaxID=348842 RepID=UPI000417D3B7|nr:CoA transferase [Desulfovirgula thermocuniculi]